METKKIGERIVKFLAVLVFIPVLWIILLVIALIGLMLPFVAFLYPDKITLIQHSDDEENEDG